MLIADTPHTPHKQIIISEGKNGACEHKLRGRARARTVLRGRRAAPSARARRCRRRVVIAVVVVRHVVPSCVGPGRPRHQSCIAWCRGLGSLLGVSVRGNVYLLVVVVGFAALVRVWCGANEGDLTGCRSVCREVCVCCRYLVGSTCRCRSCLVAWVCGVEVPRLPCAVTRRPRRRGATCERRPAEPAPRARGSERVVVSARCVRVRVYQGRVSARVRGCIEFSRRARRPSGPAVVRAPGAGVCVCYHDAP